MKSNAITIILYSFTVNAFRNQVNEFQINLFVSGHTGESKRSFGRREKAHSIFRLGCQRCKLFATSI